MVKLYRILRGSVVALGLVATLATSAGAQSMSMGSDDSGMSMMAGVDTANVPRVPPVAGYAEGEQIFFIHTEVSDPEIGRVMTDMMGSPVPVKEPPPFESPEKL